MLSYKIRLCSRSSFSLYAQFHNLFKVYWWLVLWTSTNTHFVLVLPVLQKVIWGFSFISPPTHIVVTSQWMDRKQKLTCPEWGMKGSSLLSDMQATWLQQHKLFFQGKKILMKNQVCWKDKVRETGLESDKQIQLRLQHTSDTFFFLKDL